MKGEEVKNILKANGITQKDLAEKFGVTAQSISDRLGKDDVSTGFLEKVSKVTGIPLSAFFPGLSVRAAQYEEPNSVPLLPIFAQAGHLTGWSDGVKEVECDRVISPVKDVDMAVHIYGESMSPDIPNGSVVYVKKVSGRIIDFGKPYILDTVDGPLLKYVAPGHDDGFVTCISANHDPMFAPFEVSKTDIIGMYRVVMYMSMK